jgi:hypothetical protein
LTTLWLLVVVLVVRGHGVLVVAQEDLGLVQD